MSFIVGGESKEYPLCPVGTYEAWCYGLVDLGTQHNPKFNKSYPKVRLLFELPHMKNEKGEPLSMGRTYTGGLAGMTDRSDLRKHLQSWKGEPLTPDEIKGFDLMRLIGKACVLVIEHYQRSDGSGKMADGIQTILPAAKDPEALAKDPRTKKVKAMPPCSRQHLVFTIANWNQQVYDSLPKSMKEAIAASPEGKAKLSGQPAPQQGQGGGNSQEDEQIPF